MPRGSLVAVLVLVGAGLAAVPAALAASGGCGVVVDQDDARSERDAGASPDEAVGLPYEDVFDAALSYPQGAAVDTEDWFHVDWETDTEHRVMVNVSTRAAGTAYMVGQPLPSPALGLEAYEPGAEEPTHRSTAEDGTVQLAFDTERSSWDFRVFTPDVTAAEPCPTETSSTSSAEIQSYNLYWGCNPHCIETG